MKKGFVKARFISVWNDDQEVNTGCEVNFDTGEIRNIEVSQDEPPEGSLTGEFVAECDGEREGDVCRTCHEWLRKTVVVPDSVGKGMHEEMEECRNPDCEKEEYL